MRAICTGDVTTHSPHPPADGSLHIIDHLLSALCPFGIETDRQPTVTVQPEFSLSALCLERPFTVIHPGSGGKHKIWRIDRFAEVGQQLGKLGPLVITSGPADETTLHNLMPLLPEARFIDPLPLSDLAGLFASANLYIGNDSGPTHLAAAVGTPTLAIFGPTDHRIWRPRGTRVEILTAPQGTPPESRLESITVDQVLSVANRLISLKI